MNEVTITWTTEDVKELHPEFTNEQCRETLERFRHHHEGSTEAMLVELQLLADEVAEELSKGIEI